MRFVIALIASVVLIFACAKPLKKHPSPFYLGATALVGLYLYGTTINSSVGLWPYFMPLMQRCALAFLLFTIVMFIGALGDNSPLRSRLMPVRRQLSILGCIFAAGHIAFYAASYLPRVAAGFASNLAIALLLAALLIVMMAILMVTSFQVVKHRMTASTWKSVQRLAYPFYLLTYVHLAMLLAPSALAGNETAVISLTVYSLITSLYVVLRTKKALCRKNAQTSTTPVAAH